MMRGGRESIASADWEEQSRTQISDKAALIHCLCPKSELNISNTFSVNVASSSRTIRTLYFLRTSGTL
jgi:hypothetical protein